MSNPSGNQRCSVCDCPNAEVLRTINRELSKAPRTTTLRQLQVLSGFSRATLSRHSRGCLVRQTLSTFKTAKFNPALGKIHVTLPGDPPATDLGPEDIEIVVEFEKLTIRNPLALRGDGWTADTQTQFADLVLPADQKAFILNEHARALAENSERDAANRGSGLLN